MELVGCELEMQARSENERVEWKGTAQGGALSDGGKWGEGEEPRQKRERVEWGGRCCLRA